MHPRNRNVESRAVKIHLAGGYDDEDVVVVGQTFDDEVEAWGFDDEFGEGV